MAVAWAGFAVLLYLVRGCRYWCCAVVVAVLCRAFTGAVAP